MASQPTLQVQIEPDPTVWLLTATQAEVEAATTPTAWPVDGPVEGQFVLSPRSAGSLRLQPIPPDLGGTHPTGGHPTVTAVAGTHPSGADPAGTHPTGTGTTTTTAVHLPSGTATTQNSPGYVLQPGYALAGVQQQIVTAMTNSDHVTLTVDPNHGGGVLVLNGATLAFVVLVQVTA